jgi:hypothetical protein
MSKQSNQKYRKELEKKVLSTNSIDSDDSMNSTKKEEDEYVSGDFRAPSASSNNKNS